jgi:hypothetical protein
LIEKSLIIETKDDTKDNSYEAAGLGAYSDHKPIASSYASIFDTLWKQKIGHNGSRKKFSVYISMVWPDQKLMTYDFYDKTNLAVDK